MDLTPKFHAITWTRIRGCWFYVIVECDMERDRDNSGLKGDVLIDDRLVECVGVGRHALALPIQPGERIGLMVREKDIP